MRRFFVHSSTVHASQAVLSGPEYHHLRRVVRLQVGDQLALRDERGVEYYGTVSRFSAQTVTIAIRSVAEVSPPPFALSLALGLLKGAKLDLVIEKVTELGVHTIVPFFSANTVVSLPQDRQAQRLARWRRIAQSAAKQSGSRLPHITPPHSFAQLLDAASDSETRLLFSEHERTLSLRAFADTHRTLSSLWIVVGPEGGFSLQEVGQAQASGFTTVSLGPSILRAETASIAAVSLCQYVWRQSP